jgi:hypothetical protein
MGQIINRGKELIRINTGKNSIEYSKNNGITWHSRYSSSSSGIFSDLLDNGKEILANTTKGLFYSKNDGITWHKRS